ncbi:MAG TPA: glycosyltransferase [Mycobacteriales bacterium]|nr:glycosyltransferase [Mycobacteriales bacterium]
MTRPLRVLCVIARMNVGGPALEVASLAAGLDRARIDYRVLSGAVGEDEADYLKLRGTGDVVRPVPGLGRSLRPGSDLIALRGLIREIRAFRPDIVHTHTAKAGVLGRVAARTCRVPAIVHTFHGHLLFGYFSPRITAAVVATERLLAKGSTRLVTVGAQVRDDLLAARVGRAEQYVVVAPGVALPPAPTRAAARATLRLPATGPVVSLVARLTTIKRPDRFIALAHELAREHPEATFVVCGEGDQLLAMRAAAKPLGERIRFLGWRADVETVYAATDVVVLTSDNEGMPVSLIEAALCGRPAVATGVGSVAEVVADEVTGLLAEPSAAALTTAVDRLLRDPELAARLGAAAAVRAAELFSRERLVADTERLYTEIAQEKGLPRP